MKTKQIKGQCDILLVSGFPKELPPDVVLKMLTNQRPEMKSENWQFHCRLSEMTEEQAEPLLPRNRNGLQLSIHPNYLKPTSAYFRSSVQSFQSFLEANGVLKENPFDEIPLPDPKANEDYTKSIDEWQEAEQNVFNPETTLIFIRNENS